MQMEPVRLSANTIVLVPNPRGTARLGTVARDARRFNVPLVEIQPLRLIFIYNFASPCLGRRRGGKGEETRVTAVTSRCPSNFVSVWKTAICCYLYVPPSVRLAPSWPLHSIHSASDDIRHLQTVSNHNPSARPCRVAFARAETELLVKFQRYLQFLTKHATVVSLAFLFYSRPQRPQRPQRINRTHLRIWAILVLLRHSLGRQATSIVEGTS